MNTRLWNKFLNECETSSTNFNTSKNQNSNSSKHKKC